MLDIVKVCQRLIEYSFYLLFFLVPLVMTPFNHELFEFNKMILVYLLTILIVAAWLIKIVAAKKFIFHHTFMDIPLLGFLVSQFLSFLVSIDRHTSFWGYYSRFHGGLASTITYLLLFWAFVNNSAETTILNTSEAPMRVARSRRGGRLNESEAMIPLRWKKKNNAMVKNCLYALLASGFLVSGYGILEHFGIDAQYWVQDVQNRVFSTLGQPNWLAAWLVAIIPLTWALTINLKLKTKSEKRQGKIKNFLIPFRLFTIRYSLFTIFYICLLYTKSRSGLIGFGVSYLIFWPTIFWLNRHRLKNILKPFLIFTFSFLIFTFLIGSPWTSSAKNILIKFSSPSPPQPDSQPITHDPTQLLISESSDIRKVVWQGAINIWKHHPWLGTGVETFAYSYYWYRPREHNDLSEWDFLYNKAHNEYLNFAATTGSVGLGTYLLMIGSFLFWSLKTLIQTNPSVNSGQVQRIETNRQKLANSLKFANIRLNWRKKGVKTDNSSIIILSLLSGFSSILITNFFGFSVVPVALLFFLYPALASSLRLEQQTTDNKQHRKKAQPLAWWQWGAVAILALCSLFFVLRLAQFWYADFLFAQGEKFNQAGQDDQASQSLQKAIIIRPGEPTYHNEFALVLSNLAMAAHEQEAGGQSAKQLAEMALFESDQALQISPYHLNFWKNRVRILHQLGEIEEKYLLEALASLLRASELAPTDAKIFYNLALIYAQVGQDQTAIKTLEKTVLLKPNYADARYALALFYEKEGKIKEAKLQLEYILEKINPQNEPAQEKLEELNIFYKP